MASQNDSLDASEIVVLIEALDSVIPSGEGNDYWLRASAEAQERWASHRQLRFKLKQAVHMSFYDTASNWLENELSREREALTDNLHSRFMPLLRQPGATRRSLREGFVALIRELRLKRQSKPKPLS